jgi:hypothetical protein
MNNFDFGTDDIEVSLPKESYGWCKDEHCRSPNTFEYLADGLCELCWDKYSYKAKYSKES